MDRVKALVVDDDPSLCEAIREILEGEGIDVMTSTSSPEAVELIKRTPYDLILSDMKMPMLDGLALFDKVKEISPESIFVIITAHGTIQSAVDAIKRGVYDYIPKPFGPDEVRIPVRRALEKKALENENRALKTQIEARYSFQNIVGNSPAMHMVFTVMRHAASSESNVLITGESGTGKELVARAIHSNSVRAKRKFVVVNCGAIPEGLMESELFGYVKGAFTGAVGDKRGLLEEADKGTLFLDEIGELPPILEVKLLRVLQEGEVRMLGATHSITVNLRIIAATNRDLRTAIAEKKFRADLYYRLNVIPIELPPLREQKEEIPLLVNHFIQKHRIKAVDKKISGIAKDAVEALMNYHFPGNVRELENAIEYAIAFTSGPVIKRDDLPGYIWGNSKIRRPVQEIPIMPLREAKSEFERRLIVAALRESGGNISEAARLLSIHRQNLQQKIRLLKIDVASLPTSSK